MKKILVFLFLISSFGLQAKEANKCKLYYTKDTSLLFAKTHKPRFAIKRTLRKKGYEITSYDEAEFHIKIYRTPEFRPTIPIFGLFRLSILDMNGNLLKGIAMGDGHDALAHVKQVPECSKLREMFEN